MLAVEAFNMSRTRLFSILTTAILSILLFACGKSDPGEPTASTAGGAQSTLTSELSGTEEPSPLMSATPSMLERIIDSFRALQPAIDFEIYVPTELPDNLQLAKGSPYVGGPPLNPRELIVSTMLVQHSPATPPKALSFMQTGGTLENGHGGEEEQIEINGTPGTLIREARDDGTTSISIIWTTANGVLINVASAYYEPAALLSFAESLVPLSEL